MINAERCVINIMNNAYYAMFYHFFRTYQSRKATIDSIGSILKECREDVSKNVKLYVNEFKRSIDKYYKDKDDDPM